MAKMSKIGRVADTEQSDLEQIVALRKNKFLSNYSIPTDAEVKTAMDVLIRHGRSHFYDPSTISNGLAIGNAIWFNLGAQDCTMAAMEMLEQWNAHLSVAAIAAIEKGEGTVTRHGRELHIRLPKWWKTPRAPTRVQKKTPLVYIGDIWFAEHDETI